MTSVTVKSHRIEVEGKLNSNLQKSFEKVGLIVERQAKINVSQSTGHPRVQTGRLRGSITYNVNDKDVEIGSNVYYSKYLEFGTSKMPPYPWLFPAVESKRQEIIQAFKE
jgi:HK97 gp10 family phage protein